MKRHYLWIAATATILAGCTNTDILRDTISESEPELITFDTYHSGGTKAPISDETKLTTGNGGFGVYAFKHKNSIPISDGIIDLSAIAGQFTNPVFDNTKTWYNPDYVYSPSTFFTKYQYEYPRYWDKQMIYTFFAYAPYAPQANGDTKGVSLDVATGKITRNDIHSVQCASGSTNKAIGPDDNKKNRAQYSVIDDNTETEANEASDKDIKDYLLAPCVPGQKWHATNQSAESYDNKDITVGFIFHHMLSQLNVSIKAKNEEYNADPQSPKKGHEYKGIKSIYVSKLEITNLPALTNLTSNYITCQQNKVDFAAIYNTATETPLTFTPSKYSDNLEIVKSTTGAATTYSINGESATANPLYILDGGTTVDAKAAGSTDINGYIDQYFRYFVAPNKPEVTGTEHKHDLNIDYYIEYLDGKAELFSRTIQLDDATFNFDEMLASYIYNIEITISLDQIYITVDDVPWNTSINNYEVSAD